MSEPFRALNSSSNMHRRALCDGSANAEEGLPELNAKPASNVGTMLHKKEQDEDVTDLKADQLRAIEKNKRLTAAFVASTLASIQQEAGEAIDFGQPVVFKEREFFLCDDKMEPVFPPFPGHTDEIIFYPNVEIAFVNDSKYGRYPVPKAELNHQLRCYAVMVHDDLGAKRIFSAIRQPYLPSPDDFHAVEYRADDIEPARADLLKILAKNKDPNAKRTPSIDACMYCRAKATPSCPESMEVVKMLNRAKVMTLSPGVMEQYGDEIIMAVNLAKAWYERLRMILTQYPELIKLYKLDTAQQVANVTDNAEAFKALAEHLTPDEFISCCKISIPSLTAHLSKKLGVSSEAASNLIEDKLGELIKYTPKERSVKRIK